MEELQSVPFDNLFLRICRKLIYRLDNAMFNHNGSNGPNYEPTQYLLMLPFLYGIMAIVYCIFSAFCPGSSEIVAQRNAIIGISWLVGLNLLFMARRIICMPTWTKRFFYSVFVVVVTASYAFLVFYFAYILVLLFTLIGIVIDFFNPNSGGGTGGSMSSGSGTSMSGSCSSDYPEHIVVNDGSFWGKFLHRENQYDDWTDISGEKYEETSTGFKKKY